MVGRNSGGIGRKRGKRWKKSGGFKNRILHRRDWENAEMRFLNRGEAGLMPKTFKENSSCQESTPAPFLRIENGPLLDSIDLTA